MSPRPPAGPSGTAIPGLERELLDAAAEAPRPSAFGAPTAATVRLRPSGSPPGPVPPPDARSTHEAVERAFAAWAGKVVAEWNAAHPDRPDFDLADFDGCTYAPDLVRPCCLVHDLGCAFARTRRERLAADRAFRRCIIARREWESPLWRWSWYVRGWTFWAGVALFGLLTFRPPRSPP